MANALKRADAVIRWLERMKKSYTSGKIEAALMDAECARADLEVLRSRVFADIKKPERTFILPRLFLLTAAIVMLTVTPLHDEKKPIIEPEPLVLAEPIVVIREEPKIVQAKPKKTVKRQTPVKKVQQTPQITKKPVKTVAYDKINELVKTGREALRIKR